MKLDIKNIFLGILIGIIATITIGFIINDVYINIQIGEKTDESLINQ